MIEIPRRDLADQHGRDSGHGGEQENDCYYNPEARTASAENTRVLRGRSANPGSDDYRTHYI